MSCVRVNTTRPGVGTGGLGAKEIEQIMFRIEVKSDKPLEPGTYQAKLRSVEEKETQYGERLLWLFNVPEHGAEVAGFTSRSSSSQAFATLWASALNPDISSQRSWGPDDVVGRECVLEVTIVKDQKGRKKNKILQVRPARKDS
jgi:hypothetical protein